MRIISIWIGKIVIVILRLSGRRGSALPGLVIEKLNPNFMSATLSKLQDGVIVVTGTNGKTTSTKMLTYVARQNKRVLSNPTGSNFTRGIVSMLLQHSEWLGSLPYDIAVIELDEAFAAKFAQQFRPRGTVVLNVMRDQMDRFGEIDHTAELITKVVRKTTEFVVLNRDDSRVYSMKQDVKCKTLLFGVNNNLRDIFRSDDELHSDSKQAHSSHKANVELEEINEEGEISLKIDNSIHKIKLAAQGTFNAQNAAAVITAALALGYTADQITNRLKEVKAAFGRGENLKYRNSNVILQLVKNPSGFRHALISGSKQNQTATIIAINDNYADGRDVSWLWDVNFRESGGIKGEVFTTGSRAADMALRLKYDDIITNMIVPDFSACLDQVMNNHNNQTIIIYTTYTAMLELRRLLTSKTDKERI